MKNIFINGPILSAFASVFVATTFTELALSQPVNPGVFRSEFMVGTTPQIEPTAQVPAPPSIVQSAPLSPFSQGLQPRLMSETEVASLRTYLDNSRERLQKALNQAKGRTSQEAITIYERAILDIVPASNQTAGSLELLMRMSLNQGLDLVTGIPGSKKAAALASSQNTGLKAQVLEGSIKLAMKYFMDPKSLNNDALTRLPFRELGWNRLHQTIRWWSGIEDSAVALEFVERSLGHWLAIAQMARNDVPLMAQEMVDVNNILVNFERAKKSMATMSNEEFDQELRGLRGEFEDLLNTLQRKAQVR